MCLIAEINYFKSLIDSDGVYDSWWNWQLYCVRGRSSSIHTQVCRKCRNFKFDKEILFKNLCKRVKENLGREVNPPEVGSSKERVRIIIKESLYIYVFILGNLDYQVRVCPVKRSCVIILMRYLSVKNIKNQNITMMFIKKMMTNAMMTKALMMKVVKMWMMTMLVWNMMMRMINGNWRSRRCQWIKVAYQNVPQGLSTENKEELIETILTNYRPHVLGLAEPRSSELSRMFFDGYHLVSGTALGIDDPRLNVLIKEGMSVEMEKFDTEVPSLLLKIGQARVLLLYREWNKDGKEEQGSFPQQEARWKEFVDRWSCL